MIDKYGTDAFRFTLVAFTAQGRDVRMSEERIQGYKHFVNKIWNAVRFSMMNLADYPKSTEAGPKESESLPDKWIRSRLAKTASDVTASLDEYRFNDAAAAIYQFIWHELCDWYLELVKPVLYARDNAAGRLAAQHTLFEVLRDALKLLHPVMPFLTEEIWQNLVNDGTSIMVSDFPKAADFKRDEDAEKQMEIIMEIINRVRNIRGEMNIAPSKKLKVLVSSPDRESLSLVDKSSLYIKTLANLESVETSSAGEEPKGAATGVVGAMKVYVLLEGMIDIAGERARLEKELARVSKDLSVVQKKLANSDFREKAAAAVVEKEEEKYKQFMDKHAVLEAALSKLKKMA
jgi:valyl-tRNA synthetase